VSTLRNGKHLGACQQCKRLFQSVRSDAKFCSSTCRVKFHKEAKMGIGKTWHAVSEPGKTMATEIEKLSKTSYTAIDNILREFGARAAENAIIAAYSAAMACFDEIAAAKSS